MKELSIEEKAKRYDEAIEIARQIHDADRVSGIELTTCKEIFPELTESEDEKMRKAIHIYLDWLDGRNKDYQPKGNYTIKDMIAWLEKQGDVNEEYWRGYREGKQEILDKYAELEKQGEPKPADKVEPKFKVDDWIVRGKTIAQILDIQEQYYVGLDIDGNDFTSSRFLSDDKIHLWTIQDAKDGDVLVSEDGWICVFKGNLRDELFDSYCFIDSDGWFCPSGSTVHTLDHRYVGQFYPATKEQRDILFQKMKENGYEWDAEKKELRKFQQKPATMSLDEAIEHCKEKSCGNNACALEYKQLEKWLTELKELKEQKPAWSEEDERLKNDCISSLEEFKVTRVTVNCIKWLKSLKDRVQPKQEWSEDDSIMIDNVLGTYKTLEDMLDLTTSQDKDILESMNFERDWIKSLKYRIQPKQEWSEEDERQWNDIWDVLDGRFELSKEGYKSAANWFKSIKDRYTWKPSDEQISVLSRSLKYINTISQNYCHVLGELLAQLKKLREE